MMADQAKPNNGFRSYSLRMARVLPSEAHIELHRSIQFGPKDRIPKSTKNSRNPRNRSIESHVSQAPSLPVLWGFETANGCPLMG